MLFKNVSSPDRIKDQYIANVALKANIKIGGSTNIISSSLSDKTCMFLGMDVTHPAPGSAAPSIAALVASMDKNCTNYSTYLHQQPHRVEVVEAMDELIKKAVFDFQKVNKQMPKQIIMYRDGVASGQFPQVISIEIASMKKGLAAIKCNAQVTFIVIQKRHHIRFFPQQKQDMDRYFKRLLI